MTTECSALPAVSLLQLARDKASRRRSNLSLGKDIGSAAVELMAVT